MRNTRCHLFKENETQNTRDNRASINFARAKWETDLRTTKRSDTCGDPFPGTKQKKNKNK